MVPFRLLLFPKRLGQSGVPGPSPPLGFMKGPTPLFFPLFSIDLLPSFSSQNYCCGTVVLSGAMEPARLGCILRRRLAEESSPPSKKAAEEEVGAKNCARIRSALWMVMVMEGTVPTTMAAMMAGSDCCSSRRTVSPSGLCPSWVHASVEEKQIEGRGLHYGGVAGRLGHHPPPRRHGTRDLPHGRPPFCHGSVFSILMRRNMGVADPGYCSLSGAVLRDASSFPWWAFSFCVSQSLSIEQHRGGAMVAGEFSFGDFLLVSSCLM